MNPVPGKLYKTVTMLSIWQYSSVNSTYTDREDDRSWSTKQIVEHGVVMMLVRTLPNYNSPGCIHELVDQNGVLVRAYLSDIRNHNLYFEEVEP